MKWLVIDRKKWTWKYIEWVLWPGGGGLIRIQYWLKGIAPSVDDYIWLGFSPVLVSVVLTKRATELSTHSAGVIGALFHLSSGIGRWPYQMRRSALVFADPIWFTWFLQDAVKCLQVILAITNAYRSIVCFSNFCGFCIRRYDMPSCCFLSQVKEYFGLGV